MINLEPRKTNNFIIYADTVSPSKKVGDYFFMTFTNTFTKQVFGVVPKIIKRNQRFVELQIENVGVNGQDQALDGKIYLFPDGNFTYNVFNTDVPTLDPQNPCLVWNTAEDFWNFATTLWNVCGIIRFSQIDAGQSFLYSEVPCQREVEFIPYESNDDLRNIVFISGVPLHQFPCTILAGTTFTVEVDTNTYCTTVKVENGATLIIKSTKTLNLTTSPYVQC
jgi:hypothetical protein